MKARPCLHRPSRGSALIIALILLVVIGLTSAVAMRTTLASEQSANSLRLEGLAQQYAEMALRYCERQMDMEPADRVTALQSIDANASVALASATWNQTATWVGTAATALEVPDDWVSPTGVAFTPRTEPQCFVERVRLDSNVEAFLVTARGYSPDFEADGSTGRAKRGASVWLQSFMVTE